MNIVFKPYLHRFIIIFLDDIMIYNHFREDHVRHLEQAFQVLLDGKFFLKFSKCSFGQMQVEYLGHMASAQGIAPIFAKIQAMEQWPRPKSYKAVRSFLGLAGFYRRFIHGYASIMTPLTTLLTRDEFDWQPAAQLAFDQLKATLSSALVLVLPNFSIPFVLETNA